MTVYFLVANETTKYFGGYAEPLPNSSIETYVLDNWVGTAKVKGKETSGGTLVAVEFSNEGIKATSYPQSMASSSKVFEAQDDLSYFFENDESSKD